MNPIREKVITGVSLPELQPIYQHTLSECVIIRDTKIITSVVSYMYRCLKCREQRRYAYPSVSKINLIRSEIAKRKDLLNTLKQTARFEGFFINNAKIDSIRELIKNIFFILISKRVGVFCNGLDFMTQKRASICREAFSWFTNIFTRFIYK